MSSEEQGETRGDRDSGYTSEGENARANTRWETDTKLLLPDARF